MWEGYSRGVKDYWANDKGSVCVRSTEIMLEWICKNHRINNATGRQVLYQGCEEDMIKKNNNNR